MALAAPTYHPSIDPATLAANQRAQADKITPEAAELNTKLQQLPAYQEYVQSVLFGHQQPNQQTVENLVQQAQSAGVNIPDSMIFDPFTGQVREKNWNESNSGWSALMYVGLTTGLGLVGGGIVGAAAGGGGAAGGTAAATGVGLGETEATVGGLSSAALPGAVAAPSVFGTGAVIAGAAPVLEGTAAGTGATTTAAGLGSAPGTLTTGELASTPFSGIAPTTPVVSGMGADGGADALLASSSTPAANMTSAPNVAPSGGVPSALGTTGATGSTLTNVQRAAQLLQQGGSLVSGATQAAGQTQLTNAQLGIAANNSNIAANNSNIQGQTAYETELENRAKQEQSERSKALLDLYIQSKAQNPSRSPFNTAPAPKNSDAYMAALQNLSTQGGQQLANSPAYGTLAMPQLKPTPTFSTMYAPSTTPSTGQQIGNYVAPALGLGSTLLRMYAGS